MNKPQLILALDVDTPDEARRLVDDLSDIIDIFKVGSQIFTSQGPGIIDFLRQRGKKIFLDLKFHDIPNTVAGAVKAAVHLGVYMLTVHTCAQEEMLQAAVKAARMQAKDLGLPRPLIVGVTVLTSAPNEGMVKDVVLERARLSHSCGLDGVVASVEEAGDIRRALPDKFLIITPGIRPQGTVLGDQKRSASPKDAVLAGSNFLVVGRPILKAPDPRKAALKILEEINEANNG